MTRQLVLKWTYASGNGDELLSTDSTKVVRLFRLKILEEGIESVEIWHGREKVVMWKANK